MSNNLHAVATFPARRSSPQTPKTWGDCRDVIRAAVRELRKRQPRADERRLGQLLAQRIEADGDLLEAGALYLAHDALTAEQARKSRSVPTPRARAARRVIEKVEVQELAAKVREQVALDMTVTLLDGTSKALRFCLGRELSSLGAAYGRIAERVGADVMVGEALTSAEAQELMSNGGS
jgi:hypothetical protein